MTLSKASQLMKIALAALSTTPAKPDQTAQGVPEGWKLVPIKPTDAMVAAGYDADATTCPGQETAEAVWSAMLSTAPQPERTTDEKGEPA